MTGKVVGFKVMRCRQCWAPVRYVSLSEMPLLCPKCKPICKHPERARLVTVPDGNEWCGWCGKGLNLEYRIEQLEQENAALRAIVAAMNTEEGAS